MKSIPILVSSINCRLMETHVKCDSLRDSHQLQKSIEKLDNWWKLMKLDKIWCCGCFLLIFLHTLTSITSITYFCSNCFSFKWLLTLPSETRWHWRSKVIHVMAAHLPELHSQIWMGQRPYLSLSQKISPSGTSGNPWAKRNWRSAQEDRNGRSFVLVWYFASGSFGW